MAARRDPIRKAPLTVKLPVELLSELKDFAAREVGRPLYVPSLSALVEQAVRRELERLNLILAGGLPQERFADGSRGESGKSRASHPKLNASRT